MFNFPAAGSNMTPLQHCATSAGLVNTTNVKPTNHILGVYSMGERTCTVRKQKDEPPCCILTREINCREEEEGKMDKRSEMGRWNPPPPTQRAESKKLKENTGKQLDGNKVIQTKMK